MDQLAKKSALKILVLTSTFPRWQDDTVPSFVMGLCKRLAAKGMDIDVLAPHAAGTQKSEIMAGVSVHRYQYFYSRFESLAYGGGILVNIKKNKCRYLLVPFFIGAQIYSLSKQIKANQYDLIHAHWLIPQGLVAVFVVRYLNFNKPAPKILCTSHGGDLFALQSGLFSKLKAWVLNQASAVTVVSEYMRQVCLPMTRQPENIRVCPMGVDVSDTFIPSKKIKRQANKILFVGRLVEKKGVHVLLNAIAHLIKTQPEVKLVIVGNGPEKKKLEQQCQDLKIEHVVEFLGALTQAQLPAIYASATITVMPSIVTPCNDQEGLGLVLVEAMGCGCAVIASALPAINDVIEDGVNGILVKPDEPIQLANAIDNLLLNPATRDRLATNGRQTAKLKFDWQIIAARYQDIIYSVCK